MTEPGRTPCPRLAQRLIAAATAGLAALATDQLTGHLLPASRPALVAVADQVIARAPAGAREWAIRSFGTGDKPALLALLVAVLLLAATGLGVVAVDRVSVFAGGVAAVTLAGLLAAVREPAANPVSAVTVAGVTAAVAITVWCWLTRTTPRDPGPRAEPGTSAVTGGEDEPALRSRRRLLGDAAAILVLAGTAQLAAVGLSRRVTQAIDNLRRAIRLPAPEHPLGPPPADIADRTPGLSPLFTPNGDFYRIDTALLIPQVDPDTWSLQVDGLVGHRLRLSYDDLLALPQTQADITLCCVSNPVGGPLIGTARWQGVRLAHLLELAGVESSADQVVARSVDGFTAGFPLALATDGRDALVAIGMNGEPLPIRHGFPARLVVPGLYGYVSATKWLASITLTRFADFTGFWVGRGWAPPGPIHTESRIDVPRNGARLAAKRQVIAGVAWAQHRGVHSVQIQIDDGPWQPAQLSGDLGVDSWRQWRLPWAAASGRHRLTVRATDGTGTLQTPRRREPFPAGATGWHSISVDVR